MTRSKVPRSGGTGRRFELPIRPRPSSRQLIPRVIHQMWIGPPIPDLYREYVEGWKTLHPGWTHEWWTEDNLPRLRNQDLWDRAPEIVPRAVEQFRADVARYELLFDFGGVWVDVDTEAHQPIDDLIDDGPWVVRHAGEWFANGVMAFPVGHPAMQEAIDGLAESVKRTVGAGNTRRSGPQYLTPIIRPYVESGDVRALASECFIGYEYDQLELDHLRGIWGTHHWHNQRRIKGLV